MTNAPELPVLQHVYDLILWFTPRLNKFPRDHKFMLGDRLQKSLLELLEGIIRARYRRDRLEILEHLNTELNVLRYQVRLCFDLKLLDERRFEYASGRIDGVGAELGAWIKHQKAAR